MSNCNTCPSKGKCGKKEDACGIVNNPKNHIQHVIAVMSGKGGVGKSSCTVLTAKELRKRGFSVGIMDADITGPSIPRLMNVVHEKAYGTNDAIEPVIDKDGIKLMSLNFLMEDENQPVIWRGPIVGNAVKQFWTDVVWGDLDYLLIDMPPGTGDVPLTVFQSLPVDGIIVVTSPQELVQMIVKKAYNMAEMMQIPVLGIVENFSYLKCPDCGKEIRLFGESGIDAVADELGVPVLGKLPLDPDYAKRADLGIFSAISQEQLSAGMECLKKL